MTAGRRKVSDTQSTGTAAIKVGRQPQAGYSLAVSSTNIAGKLETGAKAAGLSLLAAIFLSGCVGGPGTYFESVSRDARKTGTMGVEETTDLAALSVDTVEQQTLAPIDGSTPPQAAATQQLQAPATLAAPLQPSGEQSLAQQPLIASNDVQAAAAPTALALSNNDEILTVPTLPQPSVQQAQTGANPLPGVAGVPTANANAYSDASYASVVPQATALLGTNGGFSIGTETQPVIDPYEQAAEMRISQLYPSIRHGQCKSGRGPLPKRMGAERVTPGDPYYIEIRMRQTPLMPVGHTYVAYGKLGANGEILDEKLIMLAPTGGYVGAAIASGVPMPGVLTPHPDDCRIRPDIAYRVSLNAQRYEKLLMEIRKAKHEKPKYLLFANNCNHFMTRIAGSVGIRPPRNIYVPAVQYLHDMIEANEGVKVARW